MSDISSSSDFTLFGVEFNSGVNLSEQTTELEGRSISRRGSFARNVALRRMNVERN
jgi:hypothetical protein